MPTSQLEQLIEENERLRASFDELLAQAQHNQEILQRYHQLNLQLISTDTLVELLHLIFEGIKQSSFLDIITIYLIEPALNIQNTMSNLQIDLARFPELLLADQTQHDTDLGKLSTYIGPFDHEKFQALFPNPLEQPQSVAIIPLTRHKVHLGYLSFGSNDITRFIKADATDFIEQQASLVSICLENVISSERLKYISLTDPLTGANNRRHLEQRLQEEVSRSQRHANPLACLYIDIDHFKSINDLHGHADGDAVLCQVAATIKQELRLSDTLARFGGEEFVVLLVNTHSIGARHVAERIRKQIATTPVKLSGQQTCSVTISIGIGQLHPSNNIKPAHTLSQELLAKADEALYRAKESGRNKVVSNNP